MLVNVGKQGWYVLFETIFLYLHVMQISECHWMLFYIMKPGLKEQVAQPVKKTSQHDAFDVFTTELCPEVRWWKPGGAR